jgi:DeoR/GlpR family transcriptional regulator of sugar metabolism
MFQYMGKMSRSGSAKREAQILSMLNDTPGISVAAMSNSVGVSEVTIRKILERLENNGAILRRHGTAVPAFHPDIVARQATAKNQKNRIARAAAEMIGDGDTIMINSSATAVLIAKYLLGKKGVRIVTNCTLILPYARVNPLLHVTLVGSEFRPSTEALVGPTAIEMLDHYHAKFAFLGTAGFSVKNGITAHVAEEAAVVRKMADRSEIKVLVTDSSKFGKTEFVCYLSMSDIDTLITDTGLVDAARDELLQMGIEVIRV